MAAIEIKYRDAESGALQSQPIKLDRDQNHVEIHDGFVKYTNVEGVQYLPMHRVVEIYAQS